MGLFDATFTPDTTGLKNEINSSAQTQQGLAGTLLQKLQGGYQGQQDKSNALSQAGLDASRASSADFLKNVSGAADSLGENLSNSLLRRTAQANQVANQGLAQSLAATGGLQRGGADAAFQQQAQNTANNLSEGNNSIVQQTLAARQQALSQNQSQDQNALANKLGIDSSTLNALYASGRTDLINEANSLMGIEQNRSAGIQGVDQYQNNVGMANTNGSNNANSGLASSLLGAAGTAAGMYFGGPMGAAAGGALAGQVAGSPQANGVTGQQTNPNFAQNQMLMRNSTMANSGRGTVNPV